MPDITCPICHLPTQDPLGSHLCGLTSAGGASQTVTKGTARTVRFPVTLWLALEREAARQSRSVNNMLAVLVSQALGENAK